MVDDEQIVQEIVVFIIKNHLSITTENAPEQDQPVSILEIPLHSILIVVDH